MKSLKSHYFNNYSFALKLFLASVFGFFLVSCARDEVKLVLPQNSGKLSASDSLNINTATLAELEKLPFIGAKTAEKIIEHREKYGRFRRAEHLLLVQGVSEEKFRQIKTMIKAE